MSGISIKERMAMFEKKKNKDEDKPSLLRKSGKLSPPSPGFSVRKKIAATQKQPESEETKAAGSLSAAAAPSKASEIIAAAKAKRAARASMQKEKEKERK